MNWMNWNNVPRYLKGFVSIQQLGSILAVLRVMQARNTDTPQQELIGNIMTYPAHDIVKATNFVTGADMLHTIVVTGLAKKD